MNIEIRRGHQADAQAISQFQLAMASETENKQLDSQIVESAVRAVFADSTKGQYLVAVCENRVIGSLLITSEWSDWRNCQMWYIQSLYIVPKFRGQGIFRQMYNWVLQQAHQANVMFVRLYVETENVRAQKVYESLGMKRMPYYMYDVLVQSADSQ